MGRPARRSDAALTAGDLSQQRMSAAEVPSITGLRLSPFGAIAALINISSTGLLAECTMRVKVDAPVQVTFEGDFTPGLVAGRIARCEVSAMGRDGLIRYQVGIAFAAPIPLEEPAARASAPQPEVQTGAATAAPVPPPPVTAGLRNRW